MLRAMCSRPKCRKPLVTTRHHSPLAIDGPKKTPCSKTHPWTLPGKIPGGYPLINSATNAIALIAIRIVVNRASFQSEGAVTCEAVITFVRSPAHSGQRMPTGDGVMQSVQIGRPHEE